LSAPRGVSSVRGDHDHFAYRDRERSLSEVTASLARAGVDLVHNEVRTLEHAGKRIAVIYLSYNYIVRTSADEIRALVAEGTTLIVTPGIGYSIAPFRYAAPASIEVIDLRL
jgi:predicted MPP superfamily phosphohydrolase